MHPRDTTIKKPSYFFIFVKMVLKYELQSIISRAGKNPTGNLIEAAAHHLAKSKGASGNPHEIEFSKDQEATQLMRWVGESNVWFTEVDENRFIARGAEQRVYLDKDMRYVIKLNDSIFYAYWLDYFYSLLIHNFLFPKTTYELIGFYMEDLHDENVLTNKGALFFIDTIFYLMPSFFVQP
jgi:hypothetical protein